MKIARRRQKENLIILKLNRTEHIEPHTNLIFFPQSNRYKDRMPPPSSTQQFPATTNPNVIYSGPYSDPGYLQMALGAYLTPSSSVYKSVDPYFLSQG